jgi:hypothetical protein
MRRVLLALIAAAVLGGCASFFEDAYDDQARAQCDADTRASERGACYDRIEEHRRERDRE